MTLKEEYMTMFGDLLSSKVLFVRVGLYTQSVRPNHCNSNEKRRGRKGRKDKETFPSEGSVNTCADRNPNSCLVTFLDFCSTFSHCFK